MKIYKGNPEHMATSYMLARSHPWYRDPNPTVSGIPGRGSMQNNASDAWSQGPNGGPPAGGGTTGVYNPHNPYVVHYTNNEIAHRQLLAPIHYTGPIPESNKDSMLKYADQLRPLRDKYIVEWLASTSPEIREQMIRHTSTQWKAAHDDTTPHSRNGGRFSHP